MFLGLSRTPRANLALDYQAAKDDPPVSAAAVEAAVPAAGPTAAAPVPGVTVLDEPVSGSIGNQLSAAVGPVAVIVDKDTSYVSNDAIKGGTVQVVEFLGRKALKVTKNSRNEIRVAFVLDKPIKLTGFRTLEFSVAGFDGAEGSYNFGLLWTSAKDTGERIGSFYVGRISNKEWVPIQANLAFDEQWGKNFTAEKELYCVQFWTNQAKAIYVSDLALK